MYVFTLRVCPCSDASKVPKQTTKTAKTQGHLHCGFINRRVVEWAQTGPLCVSRKKGGVNLRSYLMCVCQCVFYCVHVDTDTCFRNAWGLCWQRSSRKHMFSADRAGRASRAQQQHKGNKKETRVLLLPCQRGSFGGGRNRRSSGFLSKARAPFGGPILLIAPMWMHVWVL